MKNNLEKTKKYLINQGSDFVKAINRVVFINIFGFQIGILTFVIFAYFYNKKDITFSNTGWFPLPENTHWYQIFVVLIVVRMLIVFITQQLTKYIKNVSLWTEKKKKNALNALAAINILTWPINLPFIGAFYAYIKGKEILFKNEFLGTFRRILNENERDKLYQETIQNFLEKSEASKEIKDKLKNWAIENTKSILEKYDEGSAFATKYLSENLEIQKQILQLEEIKKHNQVIKNEDHDSQGWWLWVYEHTTQGLNYFNPWGTDPITCAKAWGGLVIVLVIAGFGMSFISKCEQINALSKSTQVNSESIKTQAEFTQQGFTHVIQSINAQDLKLKNAQNFTNNTLYIHEQKFDGFSGQTQRNENSLQQQIQVTQEQIQTLAQRNENSLQQHIQGTQEQIQTLVTRLDTTSKENILTPEQKNQIQAEIFKKYENESISMKLIYDMFNEILEKLNLK